MHVCIGVEISGTREEDTDCGLDRSLRGVE